MNYFLDCYEEIMSKDFDFKENLYNRICDCAESKCEMTFYEFFRWGYNELSEPISVNEMEHFDEYFNNMDLKTFFEDLNIRLM